MSKVLILHALDVADQAKNIKKILSDLGNPTSLISIASYDQMMKLIDGADAVIVQAGSSEPGKELAAKLTAKGTHFILE